MDKLEIGKRYAIHSYKHNGQIYKAWDEAVLLDYDEEKGWYVFGNDRTKVTEADGRTWRTKEPAVLFFFRDHWYNIIGQLKNRGLYYYCNLASPVIIEEDTIKYIDYDLDVKVFPGGSFKVVDRGEYNYHRKQMAYPDEIDIILKKELSNLIGYIRDKDGCFNFSFVKQFYLQYQQLKENKEVKE